MPLSAGTRLGPYVVIAPLGAGGMGEVYKARDPRLNRFVAIKVLPAERLRDDARRQRFVQEARAASALNHPNILAIYDIAVDNGRDYMVMEYLPGRTLDALIPRAGMPLAELLKISIQISEALSSAHAAGIIHRDLKPSNIMVSELGSVKILDFGLAKLTERGAAAEDDSTLTLKPDTEPGMVMGTAAYMSPEQAEGKPVDTRSDIFSFGSVLYEMVTGCRAFSGETSVAILAAILHHEPKRVRGIVPEVPLELDKLIARCLSKDPNRRFQSMRDVKSALEELAAPAQRSVRTPVKRWSAVLLACVLLAGASFWLLSDPGGSPSQSLAPIPLTSYPGLEHQPAFSPDGRQVAFSWNRDSAVQYSIYVQFIGSGPPLRLTTHKGNDRSPSWSPDGRTIAFLRELPSDKTEILLIPALGGPERKLGEIYTPDYLRGHYMAWTPDGAALVVTDRPSADKPFSLYLLPVDGGEKRQLTSPPPQYAGDSGPAFSPDGRTLAFTRSVTAFVSDLYCATVSKDFSTIRQLRQVTAGHGAVFGAAWLPDGRSIIFSSHVQGTTGLWRVPAFRPGEPRRVSGVGENAHDPVISPHMNRLVYSRQQADLNIWRTPGRMGRGPSARFITSTRIDADPDFSADGKKVAFASDRSGNDEIWICDSDGSNPMQLTSFGGAANGSPRWSPDAKHIAFDANVTGQWQIHLVDVNGGRPRRITNSPESDIIPTWSRNGKWIYFASHRSGDLQVWKVSLDTGLLVQVTRHGGFMALESADGNYVYYTKNRGEVSSLWRVPAGGGEEIQVLAPLDDRGFAVVRNGIYFRRNETHGRTDMYFLNMATKSITPVATLDGAFFNGLSVSPDEQWILYGQSEERAGDLVLVENFR